jgi:UDP-N-acetylglucosamine--N-acetylmuramyl-(pentapeptide) pyrophosphoryl-undecaprenol N-acetylglucosamine transferase
MKKYIILTGGGTAGHVLPALSFVQPLRERGWNVVYVGRRKGIERDLTRGYAVEYCGISSGKLRRYFSWQNLIDPLKVVLGVIQATLILVKYRPKVVFSKGGYVALPVTIAAFLLRKPVIVHESDLSPGLANRVAFPFCKRICLSFDATADMESMQRYANKMSVTGHIVRNEIISGSKTQGVKLCNFKQNRRVILFVGGSIGSVVINNFVINNLQQLRKQFNIIHITGDQSLNTTEDDYYAVDYADIDMPNLLAYADLVVSRAGANILSELVALKKSAIAIPLSSNASRGEQYQNAIYYARKHNFQVITEDKLDQLLAVILNTMTIGQNNNWYAHEDSIGTIMDIITQYTQ